MIERIEELDSLYRRRLWGATGASIVLQAAIALLLHFRGWSPNQFTTPDQMHLGYAGPNRIQPELEVLEPNSVQSYFYQKAREGRARAIEYRILQPIELSPGPQPIAVRNDKPQPPHPETENQNQSVEEVPDVVMPLQATHSALSYSEDFQILKLVKPIYPDYELSQGIRARLLVNVWVTPSGDLENEQIQETTTDPPGASPRGFEIATLDAVRQWKVKPPKRYSGAQGIWLTIPIQFDPEKDSFIDFDHLQTP